MKQSLTVPYTIELARRVEPFNVKWIEEFLPPDDYDGYSQVKQKVSSCLLTTGEHEYTRYGFRKLLEGKCADVLQPDITLVGGITEARRVVALAAAFDIPVRVSWFVSRCRSSHMEAASIRTICKSPSRTVPWLSF